MSKEQKTADPGNDPFLERERDKYGSPVPSREYILDQLEAQAKPMGRKELAVLFGLDEDEEAVEGLRRRLKAMERDGQLVRNRRNGYMIVDNEELIRGRVRAAPDGAGYVHPDRAGDPVYLPPKEMRRLLNGDRVVVRLTGEDEQGRTSSELVEIIEHANKTIAGRFFEESGIGFVVPNNKRLHQDVIIPVGDRGGARHGELVTAELLSQPSERRQPIGRIIEVFGTQIAMGDEVAVAARTHGIPVEWPEEVLSESAHFSDVVPEEAKQGRRDYRKVPLITIDGADARDFDDAVYAEPVEGGWKVIVAIADVAAYVQPDTALDTEAAERGNSVYFPQNVVPMLPEILSNGLCSLNPHVDRLCMVTEMVIDHAGELKRSRFFEGMMRSAARLTYEQVDAIQTGADPALREKHQDLLTQIEHLYGAYEAMRLGREARGAIDFESTDSVVEFGDDGQILGVHPIQRNDAHKLIEECMIKANVATARFLRRHKIPALYRVHEKPAPERLTKLRTFLEQTGLRLEGGDEPTPKDYSALMKEVAGRPDRHLIETIMLRSMMAAEYRPDNAGHFGLALDAYAHFTSPIRRYPDLVVHRAIKHVLAKAPIESFRYTEDYLVTLGEHCSMTDRRAEEATREAMMTLKCRFMLDRVGQEFNGVISGVTGFGLFVELDELYVDGLIHITNLEQDFFHFDAIGHRLTGERTGKEYRLTDRIRVRVAQVNVDDGKIDFDPIAHPLGPDGTPMPQPKTQPKAKQQRGGPPRGGRKRRRR
ncbi:ribonuclease R [Spiribacter sp. C176]|uniref:Ribonuclease R n=1 Tax=Spiribacter salilacus TaxID=2664894 RepID=A0A6N7QM58_9GAMM|nr:ribonuclease R [Spiribacter salilacus]MRH77566.1 ribonuclease R [Spiribacter salilacus]